MNYKMLIPILGLGALLIGSAVKVGTVLAQDSNYPPIVQKLAEKFNLNQADVQAVFEEERTQRQQERQAAFEEGLTKAVGDGVITEEQKQTLLEKHKTMQENREQKGAEMKEWTESSGIDFSALSSYIGFGHGRGPGMGMHMW